MDTDSSEEGDSEPGVRIPLGHRPIIFMLPGSRELTERALDHLQWHRGECSFEKFSNGEISTKVKTAVTNHDVFVFCARNDLEAEPNFMLMQLLFLIAALRNESPFRITVVMPCLDYSRQERRLVAGETIPPRLFLRCMKTAGADRFLTAEVHNEAEVAFAPDETVFDDLSCTKYLAEFIRENLEGFDPEKTLVCATDGGGIKETRRMADELGTGFMFADRMRPKAGARGQTKVMSSKLDHAETIIIIDDMFDTCGHLGEVCKAIHQSIPNAKIYGVAVHGYLSGNAHLQVKELVQNHNLQWIAVTNSIMQDRALEKLGGLGLADRLKVIDISKLLAGAVVRIYLGSSVNLSSFKNIGPSDADPLLQGDVNQGIQLMKRQIS